MNNSKAFQILSTFSNEEMRAFSRFIESPYFSPGKDTQRLFSYIKKYYPGFGDGALERGKVFKKLFPGEQYNEKKVKNLLSDLIRLAEQFLAHNYLKSNDAEAVMFLAEQYKEKKNDKLFFKTLKTLEDKVQDTLFNSKNSYKYEEEAEHLKAEYYIGQNDFDKYVASWQKYTEYLTASFLVRYFRKLRDKHILKDGYNTDFQNTLFNSVLESTDFDKMISILREKNYEGLWLIEIYYLIYKLVDDWQNESHIETLKKVFYANIEKFSRLENFYITNDMIDYWNMKAEFEHKNNEAEVFEIYDERLKRGIYSASEEGVMSIVLYRNTMVVALNLHKLEWLENFINNYTEKLKPEYRDNMLSLARANINFSRGDFDKALTEIGKVQYDFFMYKLDVKNLMLRIYYELGLYDQAYSLIDAYRHFISNTDEISAKYKKLHGSFLRYYSKVLNAASSGKTKDMDYLLKEMKDDEAFTSKKWLTGKAEKLAVK
jgi:hypothetical protein